MYPVFEIAASFTSPMDIGTTPGSMLWLLPLALSIAVVYKATKLRELTVWKYGKEIVMLFGSIVGFMVISGLVLFVISWIFLM